MTSTIRILACFGSLLAATNAFSQVPATAPQEHVSDRLIAAAERPAPNIMAKALSLLGVPAGAVLEGKPGEWDEADLRMSGANGSSSLPEALARFSELHPDQKVSQWNDYTAIISTRSQCVARLEKRVTFRTSGPLMTVFSDLLHVANPANPGGPTGFIGATDAAGQIDRLHSPAFLDVKDTKLLDAFESLVRQVPGVVWFVSDEKRESPELPHVCRVGFYVEGRQITTGWALW